MDSGVSARRPIICMRARERAGVVEKARVTCPWDLKSDLEANMMCIAWDVCFQISEILVRKCSAVGPRMEERWMR